MSENTELKSGRVGKSPIVLAAVVIALLGLAALVTNFVRDAVFPKATVTVDRSYYYRVTAKYQYLGTPVDFNIVVGCSVEVTDSKLTGKSYMTGIAPAVYGLKMPNGKGLVMRVPEACRGEKTWDNKKGPYPAPKAAFVVSPSFRPFMAIYDDADKPMFGWGYASDDAYESPLSELKFVSVRIDAATRTEFLAWRESEAQKNIIRRDIISWDVITHQNFANVKYGNWIFGDHCRGVRYFPIPKFLSEAIRPYWPKSRPDYWLPDAPASLVFENARLWGNDDRAGKGPYAGASLGRYPIGNRGFAGAEGMYRTGGGGFRATEHVNPMLAGDIYPVRSNFTVNTVHLGIAWPESEYVEAVVFEARRKGFVYCDASDAKLTFPLPPGGFLKLRRRWSVNDVMAVDLTDGTGERQHDTNWWFHRDVGFFQPIGFGFHATLGGL